MRRKINKQKVRNRKRVKVPGEERNFCMTKPNIINNPIGCKLLTSILLHKNLPNHRKVKAATEKNILLNGWHSPYQCLKNLLSQYPDALNTVAIMQDRNITYKELWDEAEALANYLHFELSARKGENVSLCAASSIEGLVAFFALNRLGLVNARIFNGSQADKMKYNLNNFNSRIVMTDQNNLPVLSEIMEDTKVQEVIVLSDCEDAIRREFEKKHPQIRLVSYPQIQEKGKDYPKSFEEMISSEDLASILYTSGSSGEPKPISIPNRVYTNMVEVVCKTTNIVKCDGERVIGVVSHEYPYAAINCTVMILLMGKTLIMPKHRPDNRIDFDELMEAKPNRIQAIPNFYKLLEQAMQNGIMKGKDFSSLNSVISGGERYLNHEKQELLSFLAGCHAKPLLIDGFGFGELGSATALKFGMHDYFLLMNGMEAKAIHPETGADLPLDEEGIMCFTGPTIAAGYYNNAEATKKSFVKDAHNKLWFISDTYGSVHGRKKRLVKLGGRIREYFITGDGAGNFVKVYAGTVEDVIMSCPYVSDCIVVPSDAGATPSPVAYIAIQEGGEMSKEQIIEDLKKRCRSLEKFAQPTRYEAEEVIVRTKAGKKDYGYYKGMN